MKPDQIWEELKRRRVVRVAVAYAAAVFLALQVADLTFEPLGLPDWSYRFLLLAALAGFPVAIGLAWAFDVTPEGVRRDAEGTGVEKVQASGRTGRWVVASAAAFALAVGFGVWGLVGGADEAGAEGVDNELIAVVPFRIVSSDEQVAILREGVIDMLAPILSASPRMIDSGAMIGAWRRYVPDEATDLSEGEATELARRLGAGRVLMGAVVGSGDGFSMNARLLQVPGGAVIGDASVDGSVTELREVVAQLAAQVLAWEAGVEQAQVGVLDDVPLPALEAYLEGRRAYRRNAYLEARRAFARALDVDSTFALAALGAREAIVMGLDADRFNLLERANRVLRTHDDRLPPRDREYVGLWLSDSRRSAEEVVADMAALVSRLPDKAEAWYLYGDYLLHGSGRVAASDWMSRARDAFERALQLDPGLEVAREHLFYSAALYQDPPGARELGQDLLSRIGGSDGSILTRVLLAYRVGDETQQEWIRTGLDTLGYTAAGGAAWGSELPGASVPPELVDRALDRMEATAVAAADRRQSLEFRYRYLRSAGRSAEADDQLRLIERVYGPQPRWWIEAALYWDGPTESAQTAADALERDLRGSEALPWNAGGQDACVLALWRVRAGDAAFARATAERLSAGADDPDPRHGRNALCALLLRTRAAEREGSDAAGRMLDELVDVLDDGPTEQAVGWATLEAAWMLERAGDPQAAARVAGYHLRNLPFQFAGSTIRRESARLWEAAGDREAALEQYRWYLAPRSRPDASFEAQTDSIEARFPELGS